MSRSANLAAFAKTLDGAAPFVVNGSLTVTDLTVSNSYTFYDLFVSNTSLKIPVGNTAARPAGASNGYIRYNTTLSSFEGYGVSGWGNIGGGATGGGTDQVFWLNGTTITANYTLAANTNAGTFGPITIANNVTVTISNTATWTVV